MKHYYNVKSYARTPEIQELPSLIDIQLRSFEDFLYRGRLLELFDEINPIQSFNGNLSLYFPGNIPQAQEFGLEYWFEESKYDEDACLERDMSYAAPLYVRVALVNHDQGDEVILQDIFLGDFPLMTEKGTFIINGTERVVVSQLIRSPGVYFDVEEERATGRQLSNAKLIPDRGAWMEFETRKTDYITIKFNRKRTIPVTILLRALAAIDDGLGESKSPIKTGEDEEILALFADIDNDETHKYIESSFKNEPVWDLKKKQTIAEAALIEFYKRMRPGDPPTLDNARDYLEGQLFDQRRYDLERVGRYKLNQRLGLEGVIDPSYRTISKADIVALVRHMIIINSGQRGRDDIDHLGNRRVKTVGELIGNKLRIGLRRMERVVKERMSIREAEQLTPVSLINIRPIVAAVREFFGSSQLSQFMEQTNPLSELTHKRTLSALGPGGLRRERAGFDVRDVHHSHYGRICPIETPEGPNIGLIGRLASYAKVNDLGFIETPYRKVVNTLRVNDPGLLGRIVHDDVEAVLNAKMGKKITPKFLEQLRKFGVDEIDVRKERSILGSENAELSAALAGRELAQDVAYTSRVAAGVEVDEHTLDSLRKGGVTEVDLRWMPEPELRSAPISNDLIGVELGEDVVVASSIHDLIQLCRDPDLRETKEAFDILVDKIKEKYEPLDNEVHALRLKDSGNARETAERFREGFDARLAEIDSVLCAHVESRRVIADLLGQLLESPDLNQELRSRAQAYLDSLGRVDSLRDDSARLLSNLGNAIDEFLDSNEIHVPDHLQSRIRTWGGDVVSLPGRFESLRSSVHIADSELDSLETDDASANNDELQMALSSSSFSSAAANFEDFRKNAAGSGACLDEEVFELRLKGVANTREVASRFIAVFDDRYSRTVSAFDGYLSALDPIPPLLSDSRGQETADSFRRVVGRMRELKINYLRALENTRNALSEYLRDPQDEIPDNILARIRKWGKVLHDFPKQLATLRASLHQETEAIEALRDLDVVTIKELKLKKGQSLYASAVATLEKIGRTEVRILEKPEETFALLPVDDRILGKTVANAIDIHHVIVRQGAVLSEIDIARLEEFGIGTVSIVAQKIEVVPSTLPVNDKLVNETLATDLAEEYILLEEGAVIDSAAIARLKQFGIRDVPVAPFATNEIKYLSADNEDKFIIAQANAVLDDHDQFVSNRVSARYMQGFLSVPPRRIDYMDIAPRQIVGISAALIPFLSHDAANRALMGSNMQRQAVPLLTPDVSVVSTGMEGQAAYDSGQVLVSEIEAEVISVQGHRVIVRTADGEEVTYQLRKYERSNQSTCIDQRPLVRKGDSIKPGDVIADSSSTFDGQLALGHDVLTCFLSWDGGNYEDALLISEEMLRKDKFTSIHIEKHEIEARDTKLGPEEITYDIPNVGEEALKDLDEHGIVRIGAEVGPNDILVGKITPKGEKELSPEEKLLRAIFGEQAREVKDSSLRLPHGDRGKVIDVKVFTRDSHPDLAKSRRGKFSDKTEETLEAIDTDRGRDKAYSVQAHSDLPAGVEKMVRISVAQRRKLTVGDKMAGRHGNKGVISKIVPIEDMPYVDGGLPVEIILNPLGVPSRMNIGQILELHLGWAADRMGFRAVTPVFDGVREHEIQAELGRAWMLDWAWRQITEQAWDNQKRLAKIAGIGREDFDDDMHVICAYLLDRVGESGLYDNEAIILERDEIYVRRVAVAEVLRELGYDPDEIMVYDNSDLAADARDERDLAALRVSLCLWLQQTAPEQIELSDSLSIRDLFDIANRVMFETGQPLPHYGKQTLYDGRTGEPFDRHVAVGYVHMLKLAHLVEDKAHARSTGPYSLVTQQPLGGKAQFGGQRFGEMEVWALEAYGAAHILQEMLTVKSDDVQGRVKTYESIVKGEPIEEPGIPTSFRVLVKELQSLGLAVEAITGSGDVIRFGKDDEQTRRPQPATGLLGLGSGHR